MLRAEGRQKGGKRGGVHVGPLGDARGQRRQLGERGMGVGRQAGGEGNVPKLRGSRVADQDAAAVRSEVKDGASMGGGECLWPFRVGGKAESRGHTGEGGEE
jgi:hypothetical protein